MGSLKIIDVSSDCASKAYALAQAGVETVIRYYARQTRNPEKRLTREEATALCAAGISLAAVHESMSGNRSFAFDYRSGFDDAAYAREYADVAVGQPAGSAIYFAVDFDATEEQIKAAIIPYFHGVFDAMAAVSAHPVYAVGVYGSGAVCAAILSLFPTVRPWLAQSTGWAGHDAFSVSSKWYLKQGMPTEVAELSCDPNEAGEGRDIGAFRVASSPQHPVSQSEPAPDRVIARSGLNLRAGPGTDFEILKRLPFGTGVHPIRQVNGWTLVGLEGDGAADGFVSSSFIQTTASAAVATATGDRAQIAELVRRASTAEGLAQARAAAKAALPSFPTLGCAAHLSALLRQSGINVPMTEGAGKLAALVEARGWRRISPGSQAAGDIGVCFDHDRRRLGSDHVYLVLETRGPDLMLIADNQSETPHVRSAKGGERTPTEYFLRA